MKENTELLFYINKYFKTNYPQKSYQNITGYFSREKKYLWKEIIKYDELNSFFSKRYSENRTWINIVILGIYCDDLVISFEISNDCTDLRPEIRVAGPKYNVVDMRPEWDLNLV